MAQTKVLFFSCARASLLLSVYREDILVYFTPSSLAYISRVLSPFFFHSFISRNAGTHARAHRGAHITLTFSSPPRGSPSANVCTAPSRLKAGREASSSLSLPFEWSITDRCFTQRRVRHDQEICTAHSPLSIPFSLSIAALPPPPSPPSSFVASRCSQHRLREDKASE